MTIDILKTLPNNTKCASVSAPVRRVSSVRRSLFGEVDHDDCMNFLKKELDAIAESQKKKWNFDFSIEKPTDSTEFEWTPVQPDEPIPKPYALTRLPYLYEHTENSPSKVQQNEVTMSKTLRQTYLDGKLKLFSPSIMSIRSVTA